MPWGSVIKGAARAAGRLPVGLISSVGSALVGKIQAKARAKTEQIIIDQVLKGQKKMNSNAWQQIREWLESAPSIGVIVLALVPWLLERFGIMNKLKAAK